MHRRRRARTSAPAAAALLLLGVGVALLAVEMLLRVTGFGAVRPQMAFDPNTRAVMRAGHVVMDRTLLWRESDPGPEDPERALNVIRAGDRPPPKTRKLRLLCLGDSCTRLSPGGVPYSRLLEEQLGPNEVEVFNASLPGYSSYQGLAWLRSQLLDYEPDLVIVYFGWNDHWRTTGFTDRELASRLAFWRPRILNLLERPHRPPPLRVPPDAFAANLRAIAGLVAEQGGKTVFITPPAHFTPAAVARHIENQYILPGDQVEAIHSQYTGEIRHLAGAGADSSVRICDASSLFDRLAEPELLLMSDGIHPTEQGHHVLAAILADDIAVHELRAPDLDTDPAALAWAVLAQSLAAAERWPEALARSARAVEAAPRDQDVVLGHAWLLATCPVDSLRDPARALALLDADANAAGAPGRSYRFYDVKAAALAARGRYGDAVRVGEEGLRIFAASGEDPRFAAGLRGRLERYRAGKAYVLPAGTGGTPMPSQPR